MSQLGYEAPVDLTRLARKAGLPCRVFVTHDVFDRALRGHTHGSAAWDLLFALAEALRRACYWPFEFRFYRREAYGLTELQLTASRPAEECLLVSFAV